MTRPTDPNDEPTMTQEEADFVLAGVISWLRDLGERTKREQAEAQTQEAA